MRKTKFRFFWCFVDPSEAVKRLFLFHARIKHYAKDDASQLLKRTACTAKKIVLQERKAQKLTYESPYLGFHPKTQKLEPLCTA